MAQYTKEEINIILSLKGWLDTNIDVFDLTASLTVGVSNSEGAWEISQHTFSDKKLSITLKDFEDCSSEEEVKVVFRKALKRAISGLVFDGEELW